jgi:predicted CXXCH cytochrome family protein
MRPILNSRIASWAIAAVLTVAATTVACVDETIVYRDAPRFQTPPSAAAGYLGYTDTTAKLTACGSCHVGIQAEWRGTAHASAFATLPANAQAFCKSCHTVNSQGNADTTTASGFTATSDGRYKDVQCENCHGPGLTHATNPTTSNIPLPSMNVDTSAVGRRGTCGECHAGTHHPFLSEWRASAHGAMPNSASPRANSACQSCHTGQGALKAMGVDDESNYKEKNFAGGDTLRITCAVCHDPHKNGNPGQLRLAVGNPDPDRNLCMKCHNRRAIPEISSQTRGPHSAEGPMVVGSAGWEPTGFDIPNAPSTHGNATANPRLCATCHLNKFTVNDAAGAFSYQVTGHTFTGAPCVDATGKPTTAQDCAWTAAASGTPGRNLSGCASSSCHSNSQVQAAAAVTNSTLAIQVLSNTLRRKLNAVPAGQIVQNTVYTVAEGARFNWLLANDSLTGGPVGGAVKVGQMIHNKTRMEGLLAASILALDAAYPGLPAITSNEQQVLQQTVTRTGVKAIAPNTVAMQAKPSTTSAGRTGGGTR